MSKSFKLATVYFDLAVMFEAGIPVMRTLGTVTGNARGRLKRIFEDVRKSVSQGNGLAESMAKYPDMFDSIDLTLVESAEMSGSLPECFKELSKWYEFRNRINKKLITGFVFPVAILFIAAMVIPIPEFIMSGLTLRGYVGRVIYVMSFMFVPIFAFFFIMFLSKKARLLRQILDHFVLRIPVLGSAVWQLSISRYCRGFSMLHKAGVPIIQTLEKATDLTGNYVVSGLFKGGLVSAKAGNPAIEGFSKRLPYDYLNLWQVGEESGELDKTVDKIAQISGERAELLFTEFARWLPRIVYFMVAIWMIRMVFKGYANMYSTVLSY